MNFNFTSKFFINYSSVTLKYTFRTCPETNLMTVIDVAIAKGKAEIPSSHINHREVDRAPSREAQHEVSASESAQLN